MSNPITASSLSGRRAPSELRRDWRRSRQAIGLYRCAALLWLLWVIPCPLTAQEGKIFEQEPFDIITLNEANQNRVLQTLPLNLPGRLIPANPDPNATLRVRLLSNPDEELEVTWKGIAKIELFEQRVLQRARDLIQARQFDEAFEHLTFLHDNYPQVPGLQETLDRLLYAEALVLYGEQKYERALLLLDEIHQRNATQRGAVNGLRRVLDALLTARVTAGDYRDARRIFDVARQRYGPELAQFLNGWQQRFEADAQAKIKSSRSLLEQGRDRDALLVARQAREAWPAIAGADPLLRETTRRYPLVLVGVTQPYTPQDVRPLFSWPARRVERLRMRHLFELEDIGPDGGIYRCVPGTAEMSADGRTLVLQLTPPSPPNIAAAFSGLDVSRQMLTLADPRSSPFDPNWAVLMDRVEVRDLFQVQASLLQSHQRVQALLDLPLAATADPSESSLWQPYRAQPAEAADQSFVANPAYVLAASGEPREILERTFDSSQQALQALDRGEIDLVDRVFPADVAVLQRNESLQVRAYRLPSLHVLVPHPTRPFSANRLFRRSLVYALDRQRILQQELLAGKDLPGCRLISGPFPLGVDADDPLGYASDTRIAPRSYDPRHARTLLQLALIEVQAEARKNQQVPPELTQLVFVHPASEVARIACAAMVEDLKVLGIACSLRPLPPGACVPTDNDWDLLYLDYVMQEPLVDAPRLLAADGFAACPSPYLNLALRQLQRATNWTQVGDRLRAIHQICFDDTSVIPLWQLVDSMVCRQELAGMVDRPVTTYQVIEKWSWNFAAP